MAGSSIVPSSRDVERAGRDLEQRLADGDPVLADEQHPVLGVDRHDRDRPGMPGDVTSRARAVGALDRVDPEGQVAPRDGRRASRRRARRDRPRRDPPGPMVRRSAVAGQAATAAMSGARVRPALAVEQVELVEWQDQVDDVAGPDAVLGPDDGDDVLVRRR